MHLCGAITCRQLCTHVSNNGRTLSTSYGNLPLFAPYDDKSFRDSLRGQWKDMDYCGTQSDGNKFRNIGMMKPKDVNLLEKNGLKIKEKLEGDGRTLKYKTTRIFATNIYKRRRLAVDVQTL